MSSSRTASISARPANNGGSSSNNNSGDKDGGENKKQAIELQPSQVAIEVERQSRQSNHRLSGRDNDDGEEHPEYPDPYHGRNALEVLSTKEILTGAPKLLEWYLRKSVHHYKHDRASLKKEILSGMTVAVLQVPESVAFSYVAGVDPVSGLHATFFLGFLTAALGGKPGMISGAAGALAVVMKDLMSVTGPLGALTRAERFEHLLMCVVFIGIFQMVAGMMRLAKFVRLIPHSAMVGFMNGLAIIIFMAQFSAFEKCTKYPQYQQCTEQEREWMTLDQGETWMLLVLVFGTMAIMHFFPKTPKIGKVLPASMVALIIGTAFEHGINRAAIGYDTRTVADTAPIEGGFPQAHFPDVSGTSHWGTILSYAGSLAAIGLIESVMTLQAVDEITETPPSTFRSNQECVAQGIANLFCGFFGAMGGDAMIGQSTINVMNGARGRLSGMLAGLMMLFIVVVASPVIELVPIGSLTGVLFMVVLHTFNWSTFKLLTKVRKSDAFVIVLVTSLAVLTDLAIAVGAGVAFTALVNSWDSGKVLRAVTRVQHEKYTNRVLHKTYYIYGSLFFGSARAFTELFDPKRDPKHVRINFENSLICDFSALAAIYSLQKRYASYDKVLSVEKLSTKSKRQLRRQEHVADAVNYNFSTPSFVADVPPTPGMVSPMRLSPNKRSPSKRLRSPSHGAASSMPDLVLARMSGDAPAEDSPVLHSRSHLESPKRTATLDELPMFDVLPAHPVNVEDLEQAIDQVERDPTLHELNEIGSDDDEHEPAILGDVIGHGSTMLSKGIPKVPAEDLKRASIQETSESPRSPARDVDEDDDDDDDDK